jgi:putative tricarboxylic transport membrane protein
MMEILGLLADGIWLSVQPVNLILIIIGVTLGLFIGAMPGLGSVNGVAILLPITFLVPPASAIIFLAAIYYGAMYGGAISSITLGIPGASTAVATTFDGRPLALMGKARLALVTAAVASFIGGTVSNVLFTGFAPMLASVALSFGPPEIFALMLLAFATFVGLGGDDIPKTIFSICIGLVLAAVGFDSISGEPRLVFFEITGFMHGINFLVLAIGIYGIGEMLWTIDSTRGEITSSEAKMSLRGIIDDSKEGMRRGWKGTAVGSFLGFFVGILPAAGATPGSLM